MKRLRTQATLRALAVGALLTLAGCGEGRGELDGKVTLDGQPVKGGTVSVYPAKDANPETPGQPLQAAIVDGTFTIPNVPLGQAQFTVQSVLRSSPIGGGTAPGAEARHTAIPVRYGDKAKSGLSHDVKNGKQPVELALTSAQ
jgi:hypothetical protein